MTFRTRPGPPLQSYRRHLSALSFALLAGASTCQALPDSVKEFTPGANAGFGQAFYPANVLGPPHGTSNPQIPNFSQADILTLGTGGSITFEFSTHRIINLPGPDFTVFENPVQPTSHPEQTFADTAIVAVSENGTDWLTFPFDMVSSAPAELTLKSNYLGFAGVQPSLSSPSNGVSPYDPSVSGGDQYDLATLGLTSARFVRITDSGDARHKPTYDTQGDVVYDYGNILDPDPAEPDSGVAAGFDLDAIVAIHSEAWPPKSAVTNWDYYE